MSRAVAVELEPTVSGSIRKVDGSLEWTCRSCGLAQPLDSPECRVCGALMIELFRAPAAPAPPRDPVTARWLSALLPGLGSWYARAPADGLLRLLLWLWALGMTVTLLGRHQPLLLVVQLPVIAILLALWVLAAVDAGRLAAGRKVLLGRGAIAAFAVALCVTLVLSLVIAVSIARSAPVSPVTSPGVAGAPRAAVERAAPLPP